MGQLLRVLYITENFCNQADVDDEFWLVKADLNSTSLVVVRRGQDDKGPV